MKSVRAVTCLATAVASLAAALGIVHPATAGADNPSEAELSLVSTGAEQRLERDLSGVLSLRATPDSTCLAVRVDDESILESKADASLLPASLMKIVIAAAALEVMPPNEVYETEVFVHSDALASVDDGVLRGDIYLVGGGDPVLSTPRYVQRFRDPVAHTDITKLGDRVFAVLADHGITRIEGRVVGDDSWFPVKERDYCKPLPSHQPDGTSNCVWKRSFVTHNAAGPLSGLLLNDGYRSYSWSVWGAGRRHNVRAADPAQHAASVCRRRA